MERKRRGQESSDRLSTASKCTAITIQQFFCYINRRSQLVPWSITTSTADHRLIPHLFETSSQTMSSAKPQPPRRANSRKDSWVTVDWGKPGPPSHIQGVMDQIAGFIVRDPKLIEQGKREWRKAAAIRRDRKRRAARGETRGKGTSSPKGSGSRTPKKLSTTKGKATAATGFFASLFGKKKVTRPAPSGAVKRSLTKPGQHRSNTTPLPRRQQTSRPTAARRQTARR